MCTWKMKLKEKEKTAYYHEKNITFPSQAFGTTFHSWGGLSTFAPNLMHVCWNEHIFCCNTPIPLPSTIPLLYACDFLNKLFHLSEPLSYTNIIFFTVLKSCAEYKAANLLKSDGDSLRVIDPDGDGILAPFTVQCNTAGKSTRVSML